MAKIPWIADPIDLPATACGSLAEHATEVTTAETWLWRLTGRRFGLVELEARIGDAPVWTSAPRRHGVRLPGPVASVSEVKIADVVIATAGWVVRGNWVLLVDETTRWPSRPDPYAAAADPSSVVITYVRGTAPPAGFEVPLATLACELVAAKDPNEPSRLPQRVTSLQRQGVAMALLDPLDLFDEGRTGITAVDVWLSQVNRQHLRRSARTLWSAGRSNTVLESTPPT